MKNDAENIRILEQARPKYDSLRTAQIKLSAERDRLDTEIQNEEATAVELLGTSDQESMAKIISDAWADNTAVVDEFVSIINEIDAAYRQLAGSPEQVAISRPQSPPSRTPPQR